MGGGNLLLPDYFIAFTNGDYVPQSDRFNYGVMVPGKSYGGIHASHDFHNGLTLGITRTAADMATISDTVYALNPFEAGSHLKLRLEFEDPCWTQKGPDFAGAPPDPATPPAPWAIAVNLKTGNQNDVGPEARIGVNCRYDTGQFWMTIPNADPNTSKKLALFTTNAECPLHLHDAIRAFAIDMEFNQATGDGTGTVSISDRLKKGGVHTQSVTHPFKYSGFTYTGPGTDVQAAGVALAIAGGVGRVTARLLNFSIVVA